MPFLPKCQQIEACPNCKFRGLYGLCMVLNNTNFDKKCPFYKTNKYKDKDNETNTDKSIKDVEREND